MNAQDWPRAWAALTLTGRIREQIEDFQVREVLGFTLNGSGEHLWLEVEKRGLTTPEAQQRLARAFKLAPRDVHYAGLKDRQALTTQWFSLHVGSKRDSHDLPPLPPGLRVLQALKNSRKLQRGSHRGNHFVLTVRSLHGDTCHLAEHLDHIAREGVPNYFGVQRFGHDGGNLRALHAWWQAGGAAPSSRTLRGLLLSTARAFLFNAVLAERVRRGTWNTLLDGDSLNLDGTSRQFAASAATADELQERLARLDIHPTGPLWGKGALAVSAEALILEQNIMNQHEWLCAGLLRADLEQARRPLRVAVRNLRHALEGEQLHLQFELSSGAYATAVLREIVDTAAVATHCDEEGGE
ncbi:MAG: tRNA pseudouridine(13) synthase TruD [Pseudomonadales bacterium]|jgi:tRNA pseudouridine13 synthase|nr:tRNA pseudouridine(13) synthase TruD [Pseudomonadales bacterium]